MSREIANPRTGQRMKFLKTGSETDGKLLSVECFSPSSKTIREPEHLHPHQENIFEILSGTLHFRIRGRTSTAGRGEVVVIPAGAPHHFWNESGTEAHYIQKFKPALDTESFFRWYFKLAQENKLNKKGKPNLLRISVLCLKHQNEVRMVSPPWPLQKFVFMIFAPFGRLLDKRK
jgi:mannose-6-phosphate isomerase-like protein (cupin superfamily)